MKSIPGRLLYTIITACCVTQSTASAVLGAAELTVSTKFSGGSGRVLEINQTTRTVRFVLAEQPGGDWASWWYFRVRGIEPGETVRLTLVEGKKATAGRAVFSLDGKVWRYTEAEGDAKTPTYVAKIDAEEVQFAWYVPYLPKDAAAAVERAEQSCRFARKFTLCTSEGGLEVPAVTFSEPGAKDAERYGVWVSARQHAWEVGGSWTAQGLIDWLASDDPRAAALRRKARITVVPLVDVDSVEVGRGGKGQRPHDHNRDWTDKPYWRATQAALETLRPLDEAGRLDLYLDLHDPGWNGNVQFWCHNYPTMGPLRRRNTDSFLAAVTQEFVGPLRFDVKPKSFFKLTTPTAGIWASTKTREGVVGGTFEIGVAPPKGFNEPPPSHHLRLGQQIGLAVERFLRTDVRPVQP
jgi:hypothetical protein